MEKEDLEEEEQVLQIEELVGDLEIIVNNINIVIIATWMDALKIVILSYIVIPIGTTI